MKVSIDISSKYKEPYAVICTDKVTDEIQRMLDLFHTNETPITALKNGCKDYVSRTYLPEFKRYLGLQEAKESKENK